MPAIGESRGARGCSPAKPSICARISGEALSRNHAWPSALTATLSWVRGLAAIAPSRAPRQFGQPQFHCGKPPPAADPNTLTRTASLLIAAEGLDPAGPAPRGLVAPDTKASPPIAASDTPRRPWHKIRPIAASHRSPSIARPGFPERERTQAADLRRNDGEVQHGGPSHRRAGGSRRVGQDDSSRGTA